MYVIYGNHVPADGKGGDDVIDNWAAWYVNSGIYIYKKKFLNNWHTECNNH